jgi:hypothetical protein
VIKKTSWQLIGLGLGRHKSGQCDVAATDIAVLALLVAICGILTALKPRRRLFRYGTCVLDVAVIAGGVIYISAQSYALGGLDNLLGDCRAQMRSQVAKLGPAPAYEGDNVAHKWTCELGARSVSVDFELACKREHPGSYPRLLNDNNSHSWRCYQNDWRGLVAQLRHDQATAG